MPKIDTICAIATASGQGGIGVVRISGTLAYDIATKILRRKIKPRYAYYGDFYHTKGERIDNGICLYFPAPNSYTGEDVIEIQGHGGIVVMNQILNLVNKLGARFAEAGEFSKRAFLNGKIDLIQAEAIQDIIQASSDKASICAIKSLSGEFSNKINKLSQELINLRVFIEATIDFSEEEIDFLKTSEISEKLENITCELSEILFCANQGALLRDGINVAIIGKTNAGKSSLFNSLGKNSNAIVTDIAGTTRDVLKDTIQINNIPINIIDTAGIRKSKDVIELEGINRTYNEIKKADIILLVYDATKEKDANIQIATENKPIIKISNKIDLINKKPKVEKINGCYHIKLSAKSGDGIGLLKQSIADIAGYEPIGEGLFLARKRHIIAIKEALEFIKKASSQFNLNAIELVAEDLRQANIAIGKVTGEFSSDDLLGEIFSSFCIGK